MMITVFYDGKCGLCSKEIAYYRRIAPAGIFNWQDITQSSQQLNQQGITLVAALRVLHVIDSEGKVHRGVDAFVVIWQQLPKWRKLGRFIVLPIIKPIASFGYRLVANWRFNRLKHCQLAAKSD